ncbi:MAG: hypothetical protein ACXWT3_12290 [Methylococcaceae bacterium]
MKYYLENTDINHTGVNKMMVFVKQKQRLILIIVSAILALSAVTYAYNYFTQDASATGCTSYSCINNKQWVQIPGGKKCVTC